MVLEKATRIRTKHEHEEKLKQEYRKVEGVRAAASSVIFFTRGYNIFKVIS